ncbi:MAG: hypothetical protein F4X00_14900 [Gemmatimonadetes bacterium]|nr:hypothetical protein [Gemmatimonadota bacterium]
MSPSTDDPTPVNADGRDVSAEAIVPLEDDFHLIDDPPEEDEAAHTDSAERDKPTRLRGALDSASGTLRRGVAGIGKTAGAVGDGMVDSARAVGSRVGDASAKAGRLASDSIRKVPVRRLSEPVISKAAGFGNALLATNIATTLDQWTRTVFASGPATRYDRALDQFYIDTGKYGADHRLFDGSHDLVGAWKTIAETFPNEGWLQRADGYVSAIWKDMVTPRGIPVATWDKQAFDAVAGFLNETLGVSRKWVKDMADFTATEFAGSVLAALALVLSWNKADLRRFSEIVASLGLSALVGANPLLVMVTIVGLAKCFHEARHGAGLKRVLSGGGRGMVGTTALLGASRLMPAPAWVTLVLGVVSYLVATKLYDKAEPKAEGVARIVRDWFGSQEWTSNCSDFARNTYLRGKGVVGNVGDSELARDVADTVSAWSRASAGAIGRGWSAGYQSTIRVACAAVPGWRSVGG